VETILLVQFVAFGGGLLLLRLASRIGGFRAVLASLVVWCVAVGLAFGLPAHQPVLFILLGALIGVVLGGSQALSRSLFSQLIPAGQEAEYFGLYQVSADGTSWLGPLIFGIVYQVTGTYRSAIVSLVVFFVVGFIALALVPMRRAIIAVGNTPPRLL
jgi:UMF1 family MFS transporter